MGRWRYYSQDNNCSRRKSKSSNLLGILCSKNIYSLQSVSVYCILFPHMLFKTSCYLVYWPFLHSLQGYVIGLICLLLLLSLLLLWLLLFYGMWDLWLASEKFGRHLDLNWYSCCIFLTEFYWGWILRPGEELKILLVEVLYLWRLGSARVQGYSFNTGKCWYIKFKGFVTGNVSFN